MYKNGDDNADGNDNDHDDHDDNDADDDFAEDHCHQRFIPNFTGL